MLQRKGDKARRFKYLPALPDRGAVEAVEVLANQLGVAHRTTYGDSRP